MRAKATSSRFDLAQAKANTVVLRRGRIVTAAAIIVVAAFSGFVDGRICDCATCARRAVTAHA